MRVVVLMASEIDGDGTAVLRAGDRAAAHWGVAFAEGACGVRFPRGDRTAAAYAAALGATGSAWEDADHTTAELVLVGPGAIDAWGDAAAGQLAERLEAELVFDVQRIERTGSSWRVVCDAGRGAQDVLNVAGRLVLVASDQVERPPYVSCARRMLAAGTMANVGAAAEFVTGWQPVSPRRPRRPQNSNPDAEHRANAAFGISAGQESSRNREVITGDPADCAQVLLRYLVHHGFVDRALPEASSPVGAAARAEPAAPIPTSGGPSTAVEVAVAQRRGPRTVGGDDRRQARRPRPVADRQQHAGPVAMLALQRGPRRRGGGNAGRRGPFRVTAGEGRPSKFGSIAEIKTPPGV